MDAFLDGNDFLGVTATPAGFLLTTRKDVGGVVMAGAAASPDGTTWTVLPDAPGIEDLAPDIYPRISSVGDAHVIWGTVRDGGDFIKGLWTSRDGRSWERVPLPRIVAWAGDLWPVGDATVGFAVDASGDEVRYVGLVASGDGLTWRSDTVPTELASTRSHEWRAVPVPGGLLMFAIAGVGVLLARPVPVDDPGPTPAPPATRPPEPSGAVAPEVAWTVGRSYARGRPADVVAWGDGYLAVGFVTTADGNWSAMVWQSTDGRTWTRVFDPSTFPRTQMTAVAAQGSRIVAAGIAYRPRAGDDASPVAAFWWSDDGATWTQVPGRADFVIGVEATPDYWSTGMNDVVAACPGFVAVGATRSGGATVWTSTDGTDWSRTATLGGAMMQGVTSGGPGLVAVGVTGGAQSAGHVWVSPDGLVWSSVEGLPGGAVNDVTSGTTALVAMGWPTTVWRSLDGLGWELAPDQPALERRLNVEGMAAVASMPGGFVSVGTTTCPDALAPCAAAWTSADELRWERSLLPAALPADPACPSCPVTPVAAAADGARVVVVGATYLSGPGDIEPGWSSWLGTLAP